MYANESAYRSDNSRCHKPHFRLHQHRAVRFRRSIANLGCRVVDLNVERVRGLLSREGGQRARAKTDHRCSLPLTRDKDLVVLRALNPACLAMPFPSRIFSGQSQERIADSASETRQPLTEGMSPPI